MGFHLKILSWALIFLLRLRFPPGKFVVTVLGNTNALSDMHASVSNLQSHLSRALDLVNSVQEFFELYRDIEKPCLNGIWAEVIVTANSCNISTT